MTETRPHDYRLLLTHANRILSEKTDAAAADRITLRDAVCAYLHAERARGTTLPSAIRAVRSILRKSEGARPLSAGRATERELAQQLVDWCLSRARPLFAAT